MTDPANLIRSKLADGRTVADCEVRDLLAAYDALRWRAAEAIPILTKDVLDRWTRAGFPFTDEELSHVVDFFGDMVKRCEILGTRYSLATSELRREYDRAVQIKRARERSHD